MMYVTHVIMQALTSIYNKDLFQDFQRSRAFLYLNEIKRRFLAVYGQGAQTALAYAMNTEFGRVLANEMVISESDTDYVSLRNYFHLIPHTHVCTETL